MVRNKDATTRYPYEPDYAVLPGQTLEETIEALGIDQRELALRAGLSAKHVNQIIKGAAPITPDTAMRLERVTGVPARTWNALEANFREQVARLKERVRLEQDLAWLKTIPTRELIRRDAVPATMDNVELLGHVLSFFGVATVEAWQEGWSAPQFAFRKSLAFEGLIGPMATWLRLGELDAHKIECGSFSKSRFLDAVAKIRSLTVKEPEDYVPAMIGLCADAGVALVLVPEIKGAPVSGAAKWLTPTKGMICLNLRGKYNDRFWFTFFHEAGHILNDSKKQTYIDVKDYAEDDCERRANQFAANLLIPAEYDAELKRLATYESIVAFASKLRVAPGIVVGRLQRDKVIDYSQFNGLKQRLKWVEDDS